MYEVITAVRCRVWLIISAVVFNCREGLLYDAERDVLAIVKFLVNFQIKQSVKFVINSEIILNIFIGCMVTVFTVFLYSTTVNS